MKFIMACGMDSLPNIGRDNPDQLVFHSHVATRCPPGLDCRTNSVGAPTLNAVSGGKIGA
jgi:hypothetical protein